MSEARKAERPRAGWWRKAGWILLAIIVVAGLAAVRVRRARERDSAPLLQPAPVPVETVPVASGKVSATRHFLGRVRGRDEAEVAPRVMARVLEVRVREGDRVHRGDPLVLLDARELEDAVAAAEAEVAAAREAEAAAETAEAVQRDATGRDRVLFENDAISREQWDRSRAREEAARAAREAARARRVAAERNLARVRTRLGYARLTAPFDGRVSARLADPGDLAVPGRPLLRLVRDGGVRVRVPVPEELLSRLSPGNPVRIVPPGGDPVEVPLARVFPAVGPDRLGTVEADIPRPPATLVPGGTCGVDLVVATATGPVVPLAALLENGRGTFVFPVRDGHVRPLPVTVAVRGRDRAVVRPREGELAPGTPVVVGRPSQLALLGPGTAVSEVER